MKVMKALELKSGWLARILLAAFMLLAVGAAIAAEATKPMVPAAATTAGAAGLPEPGASHPPVAPPAREGKVTVDPAAKFTHFRVGNKNVKSLFADRGVIWVGTSGGLVRYDTKDDSFKLFDTKNGLLSNGMFFVGKVKDRIAVGTYGGGLSLLDEKTGKWQTYNIPEGLGDAFVYDVITAKNGDIWIATWSGANRVRGGDLDNRSKWDLYTVDNTKGGLPNDWVYGLAEGKNGDIWLATEGGMARFAKNRWENWNHAKGMGASYDRVKKDIAFKNDPGKQSVHHAKQKEEMGLQDVDLPITRTTLCRSRSMQLDRSGPGPGAAVFRGSTDDAGRAIQRLRACQGIMYSRCISIQKENSGSVPTMASRAGRTASLSRR